MIHLISFFIAFLITTILLYQLRPLALRIGLTDQPGDRKHHKGEIPLIGGIAMFCGFMLALLIPDQVLSGLRTLIAGSTILMIIGVLDDFHDLSHRTRFLAQILVAFLIIEDGLILNDLGMIGCQESTIELGIFAWPLTILAVLMAINAVNMIDGMDGLAGGLTLITLIALSFIAWQAGLNQILTVLSSLIATILAFLRFNLRYWKQKKATVFMGDAGSMLLGFVIVWFLINLSHGKQPAMTPVIALWIFALPLFDAGTITIRRLLKGHSPFAPDREHFHHLLLNMGLTVTNTLLIMLGLATVFVIIGLLGLYFNVSEALLFLMFLSCFIVYLIFCHYFSYYYHKNLQFPNSL